MTPEQRNNGISELLSYFNNPNNPRLAAAVLRDLSQTQLSSRQFAELAHELEEHAREVIALQHMAEVIQVGGVTISGCPIAPSCYRESTNNQSILGVNIVGQESWHPFNPLHSHQGNQLKFGYDPNDGTLYNKSSRSTIELGTFFSVYDTTFRRNWNVEITPEVVEIPNYPGLAEYAVGMITETSISNPVSGSEDLIGPYYEVNNYYAQHGLIDPKSESKVFRRIKHTVGSGLSIFFSYENTQRRGIIWRSQID